MAYHLMQLFYPGAVLSPNPAVKPFVKEKLAHMYGHTNINISRTRFTKTFK